jgi:hypothetical protein
MKDKSVLNAPPQGMGSFGNAQFSVDEYVNALILEVCLQDDSLEKYEPMLRKMTQDDSCYQDCTSFVDHFIHLQVTERFTDSDYGKLYRIGERLHLTKETLDAVFSYLSPFYQSDSTEEHSKRTIPMGTAFCILFLIVIVVCTVILPRFL